MHAFNDICVCVWGRETDSLTNCTYVAREDMSTLAMYAAAANGEIR